MMASTSLVMADLSRLRVHGRRENLAGPALRPSTERSGARAAGWLTRALLSCSRRCCTCRTWPSTATRPRACSKRTAWERTWDLQREEDASGRVLDIPLPPVYRITDFVKSSYWRHRGKLDVPKERFLSYPDASPGNDGSLLLGWAGWDHLERAQALCTLIEERRTVDGWGTARLTPLLAGLSGLMPWVRQWHSEVAPVFGQSSVNVLDAYLAAQLRTHSLTDEALRSWMAPPVRRGRPPKSRRPGIQASGHAGM